LQVFAAVKVDNKTREKNVATNLRIPENMWLILRLL
jgi:hypothetical protein